MGAGNGTREVGNGLDEIYIYIYPEHFCSVQTVFNEETNHTLCFSLSGRSVRTGACAGP